MKVLPEQYKRKTFNIGNVLEIFLIVISKIGKEKKYILLSYLVTTAKYSLTTLSALTGVSL